MTDRTTLIEVGLESGPQRRHRKRPAHARLLLLTVALGLASRRFGTVLPEFVARYAGDVLWATMVYWICCLVVPRAATMRVAAAAMAIALAVECSQLVRVPWLDALRATAVGALVLGQGFLWSDLLCYVMGVGLAVGIDLLLMRHGGRSRRARAAGGRSA